MTASWRWLGVRAAVVGPKLPGQSEAKVHPRERVLFEAPPKSRAHQPPFSATGSGEISLSGVMEGVREPAQLLSGFLSKRRQTLKFQWRCYLCILTNAALSYYKVTPETDEKMQSVRAVPKITQYYPLEVVLESGKIVLLAAHNKEEQNKWLQAIWKAMVMSGQEETPCRKTPEGFSYSEDLLTLKSDSMTVSELESCRPEGSPGEADISGDNSGLLLNDDVTEDMDAFIDRTFDGISFNRQSMMGRQSHLHDSPIEVEKEAS